MCIAIYKPAGKEISYETFEFCYLNNRDGCGLTFINEEGELEIFKTMDFQAWWLAYQECLEENPTSPFVIHFRLATEGTIDEFNCHPFKIDDGHVFVHNGSIKAAPKDKDRLKSDTQMFNDTILKGLRPGWFECEATKTLIEEYIDYSKLIIMRKDGAINIYNAEKGEWKDGVWYSNEYHRVKRFKYTNFSGDWLKDGETKEVKKYDAPYTYYTLKVRGEEFRRRWVKEGSYCEQYDKSVSKWRKYNAVKNEYIDKKQESNLVLLAQCDWCGSMVAESDMKVALDNYAITESQKHMLICDDCLLTFQQLQMEGYEILADEDIRDHMVQ